MKTRPGYRARLDDYYRSLWWRQFQGFNRSIPYYVIAPKRLFLSAPLLGCALLFFFSNLLWAFEPPPPTDDRTTVVVVVGAAGQEEYGQKFQTEAEQWQKACEQGKACPVTIGLGQTNSISDLDQIKQVLQAQPKESVHELWLVLIGHGTFDGREARFNLRGPDLTATNLATWLQPFKRPLAIINCASASAPFINQLSAAGRVLITATRSGYELNYTRFGQFFAPALTDPQADLDKDGQVSLLEAFLMASRQVAEFYAAQGRLATEHALIDDNGDGLGTPADWFRGLRATKTARDGASLDGVRAQQFILVLSPEEQQLPVAQRTRRDELERAIAQLRDLKKTLNTEEYYQRLEPLLLELARLSILGTQKP